MCGWDGGGVLDVDETDRTFRGALTGTPIWAPANNHHITKYPDVAYEGTHVAENTDNPPQSTPSTFASNCRLRLSIPTHAPQVW